MLSLAQLFGYEQMNLLLFGYEQMNLFMLSLARKFGLHENSGYRLQWLVISEWFQQAPRGVCTMLKVGLLVQALCSGKEPPLGTVESAKRFPLGMRQGRACSTPRPVCGHKIQKQKLPETNHYTLSFAQRYSI